MIITTERQIALRCPICGCLELHNLSLFAFSGKQSLTVKCVCGFKLFSLSTKDHRNYFLQYTCMICDEVHMLKLRYAQIWKNDLTPILCPATGQEMGYIGSRERLDEFVLENCRSMESIMNDIGFSDFLPAPRLWCRFWLICIGLPKKATSIACAGTPIFKWRFSRTNLNCTVRVATA